MQRLGGELSGGTRCSLDPHRSSGEGTPLERCLPLLPHFIFISFPCSTLILSSFTLLPSSPSFILAQSKLQFTLRTTLKQTIKCSFTEITKKKKKKKKKTQQKKKKKKQKKKKKNKKNLCEKREEGRGRGTKGGGGVN